MKLTSLTSLNRYIHYSVQIANEKRFAVRDRAIDLSAIDLSAIDEKTYRVSCAKIISNYQNNVTQNVTVYITLFSD